MKIANIIPKKKEDSIILMKINANNKNNRTKTSFNSFFPHNFPKERIIKRKEIIPQYHNLNSILNITNRDDSIKNLFLKKNKSSIGIQSFTTSKYLKNLSHIWSNNQKKKFILPFQYQNLQKKQFSYKIRDYFFRSSIRYKMNLTGLSNKTSFNKTKNKNRNFPIINKLKRNKSDDLTYLMKSTTIFKKSVPKKYDFVFESSKNLHTKSSSIIGRNNRIKERQTILSKSLMDLKKITKEITKNVKLKDDGDNSKKGVDDIKKYLEDISNEKIEEDIFNKNQKNFFKFRKDIKEEPSLEEQDCD